MSKQTEPKLTKKERKAIRREQLAARGVATPTGLNNQVSWLELKEVHEDLIKTIQDSLTLTNYLRDETVRENLNTYNAVIDNQTIVKAIEELILPNIHTAKARLDTHMEKHWETHQDPKYQITDSEEMEASVDVWQAYNDLFNVYRQAVTPPHASLVANIERSVAKAAARAQEQRTPQ